MVCSIVTVNDSYTNANSQDETLINACLPHYNRNRILLIRFLPIVQCLFAATNDIACLFMMVELFWCSDIFNTSGLRSRVKWCSKASRFETTHPLRCVSGSNPMRGSCQLLTEGCLFTTIGTLRSSTCGN